MPQVASLLIVEAPVIGAVALSNIVEQGSLIYSQERVGQGGEPFSIHKIRSLRADTPLTTSQGVDDPRATRVGRIIRKAHIDELPQLHNILRGDMAFFGPRPLIAIDLENGRAVLSRNSYDEWEDVYMRSKPGGISTFAIKTRSHDAPTTTEQSWVLRAAGDIYDFQHMSRRYERKLAAAVLSLARHKITRQSLD